MLLSFKVLYEAMMALATAKAAPTSKSSSLLVERDCPGFGLEVEPWVLAIRLDKGDHPEQWVGYGYHKWQFPFNVADNYTVEHFHVLRYYDDGQGWAGGDTADLRLDEEFEVGDRFVPPGTHD